MLAQPHGHDARWSVRVVGGADDHGINGALLFEHDAEIAIAAGQREFLKLCRRDRHRHHTATMFSLLTPSVSLDPLPPQPTTAIFSFSLGDLLLAMPVLPAIQ